MGSKTGIKGCTRSGQTLLCNTERIQYWQNFSPFLSPKLFFDNIVTLTGQLGKNRQQIPQEILVNARHEQHSSMFGFTYRMTPTLFVPQNKAVIPLSTQFKNTETAKQNEEKKPIICLHYNTTKEDEDTGDTMTRNYLCVRATKRWPQRIIFRLQTSQHQTAS